MAKLSASSLILLAAAVTYVAADCECQNTADEDLRKVWEFLKILPAHVSEEDQAVLPGLLSPLTPCGNCLDNARRKRTVLTRTSPNFDVADFSEEEDFVMLPKADSRCPTGHARIGFRCIPISQLYK